MAPDHEPIYRMAELAQTMLATLKRVGYTGDT